MPRILLFYGLPLLLMVYAIADCAGDDDVERFSMPKVMWILLIILIPYFGPLAWLAASKIAKPRRRPAAPPGMLPRRSPRRNGPMAPDDNLDYLRRLAEEQARRERRRKDKPGDESAGTEPTKP
ncbi:MAG: PLD nuclease N-terminal domain-containing protein [Bifidobacteriaceae bacterium]|nr:PLD nuclease N-terminal domain-containing protein [Bifidobacteriaceae bacterium]